MAEIVLEGEVTSFSLVGNEQANRVQASGVALNILQIREGNGRAARVLSIIMALQAGLPLLDFSTITGKKREKYFVAIRAGLERDYEPMEKVFRKVIEKTLSVS